jgi:predicted alpha-1,2-mannosidase
MNRMLKIFRDCAGAAAVLFLCNTGGVEARPYHTYIDPLIGSQGAGNVFIGPSRPFGMVKPGPDCDKDSNSGYASDPSRAVYGFSHLHVSGTGGGPKYGNILVMPFTGDFDQIEQRSLRSEETVKTGYYGVTLKKSGIRAELTASHSAAFHKYQFPSGSEKGIKIDCGKFLGEMAVPDFREAQQFVGSEIEVVSSTEVRGYSRIRGGWNNGSAYTVYFYAVADRPFSSFGTWKGGTIFPGGKVQFDSGQKTGAYLLFGKAAGTTIQLKVGISFVSALKARQNIETEMPHWDFLRVLNETEAKWEALLSRVEIDAGAPADQKTMFYTALYHTMLMPADRTGENPLWTSTAPYYDDFYALWDTYRTSLPLLTLISPSRQIALVNALIDIYRHDGYLPDARSGNCNGRTQGGSNADVVIADAYVKGLQGIDYNAGFSAMLKDATVPPGGNEEKEGRGGLTDYNSLGYVSSNFPRAGNRTLEYSLNDYCLAEVAKGLGRTGEYRRFLERSDNWRNLWRDVEDHGSRGFIMPRDAAGNWVDTIQCDMGEGGGPQTHISYTPLAQDWPVCLPWWGGFLYEASSWEYSFAVPHDIAGLIGKCGGKDAFKRRLDTFFDNGYYNVSNEPSFLTPCLYHWIGRPDLSGERIKAIVARHFNASHSGIPGNDDSGAMSSWLAFHTLGLYPNAGRPYYLIHAPLVKRSVLHFENGREFRISSRRFSPKNGYIRSATLNGKPFNQAWIEHSDIIAGGELVLEMDSKPSSWGNEILPPSKEND